MRLLIDTPAAFRYRTQTAEYGDLRHYYCAHAPYRAIVVCRHGLELLDLTGKVVDAAVGHDAGWREFVRLGNEDTRHSKITVYRVLNGATPEERLSQVLSRAPRDGS